MFFAVGLIDSPHKPKKGKSQNPEITKDYWAVDLKHYDQNRADKTQSNEEDNLLGFAKPDDDRQRSASVFSVAGPVFDVLDDLTDQIERKGKNGVGQDDQLRLLVVEGYEIDGQASQKSHRQIADKGFPFQLVAIDP